MVPQSWCARRFAAARSCCGALSASCGCSCGRRISGGRWPSCFPRLIALPTLNCSAAALEELHLALMLLRRRARSECAEVAALPGPGIDLAGIEAVFARLELADHATLLRGNPAGSLENNGLGGPFLER